MRLPHRFTVPGVTITVRRVTEADVPKEARGHLGFGYMRGTGPGRAEICVSRRVPLSLVPVVVLHEMLHVVDQSLLGLGVTRREIPHRWITEGAPRLALLLGASGLFQNATKAGILRGLQAMDRIYAEDSRRRVAARRKTRKR